MRKRNFLLSMMLSVIFSSALAQVTTVTGLVAVVRYKDYKINATNAQVDAMLNQETGFNLWGNTTSVKQYFKAQSDNKFVLNSIIVDVDLNQNSSYYHGPNLPYNGGLRLVTDVVAAINQKYPSGFSGLTLLQDGSEQRLWHFSIISQSAPNEGAGVAYGTNTEYVLSNNQPVPIRNVALISYTQTNQYDVNVICHEYGHSVMSWTDYYRTAFCNLGDYDVMASAGTTKAPQPINPALRLQKGWIGNVVNVSGTTAATYTLTSNSYSQIHKYTNPNNPREYLLFHALKHGGYYQSPLDNGKVMDQGMAVWYVDEDGGFDVAGVDNQWFVRLVQADKLDEMHDEFIPNSSDVRGDLNDLYDNVSNTFPNGHPLRWKDGGELGISITSISAPGTTMSFSVTPRPNTVIASSDLNGTVSPKGTLAVPTGQSRTFNFVPNPGYEVDLVRVNGNPVAPANSYTLTNISGTQTVQVTFKKKISIAPLPSPWVHYNVGGQSTGLATYTSGKFYVEALTRELGNTTDSLGYIFQTLNGDGSIIARLDSTNMSSWRSRAGLMIRESLQSNSAYAMIARVPHSGVEVLQRASTGASVVSNPNNTSAMHIYSLFEWFKISRTGNVITSSCSKDGVNWTVIAQQTLAFNSSVYVGMFTTGAFNTNPAKALFTNASVTTANPSPFVSITSPFQNSWFSNPSNITINATASDNGSISRVDFYNGNTLLGTDNSSPYSFVWNNVGGGKYSITAKAVDNQQAVTTSVPVIVNVSCTFSTPKLTGTVIGTPGSWNNYGNTRDKVFDGDVNSFFDAPEGTAWVGLSLPADYKITAISYYPRSEAAQRMVGGKFQGSNTADFSSGVVDLATIEFLPVYNWNCVSITNTSAFRYVRYLCPQDGFGNVAEIEIYGTSVTPSQTPYGGVAWAIPGTVEAENYDLGGQGIAFNDGTTANQGGAFRTDAVDLEVASGGGYNLGYITNDEWTEYTVNVTAGTYTIEARVASAVGNKTFRLELDGATIASFTVPNTGGWQAWQNLTATGVALTAGQKVLRIYSTSNDFNVDKIVFSTGGTCSTPAWNSTAVYTQGMRASRNGTIYEAKWWTQNNDPLTNSGPSGVWLLIGPCTARVALNVTDSEGSNFISITPNPSHGKLSVAMNLLESERADIEIFSINGNSVFTAADVINGDELNIEALASGIYIMKINAGTQVLTQRLVVE